jgi:hypothetical protein
MSESAKYVMRKQDIAGPKGLEAVETGSFLAERGALSTVAEYVTGIVPRPRCTFFVEVRIENEGFIGLDQNSFLNALLAAAEAARCAGYDLPLVGLHPLFKQDEATWATGWGLVGPLPVNMMETTTDLLPELGAVLLATG